MIDIPLLLKHNPGKFKSLCFYIYSIQQLFSKDKYLPTKCADIIKLLSHFPVAKPVKALYIFACL